MKAIRLYRHPECERCAGYARMHHRFDWLGHFEDTTETPPTGQLLVGEIAVQDLRTGATLKGIDCFRLLCKHIPYMDSSDLQASRSLMAAVGERSCSHISGLSW